MLSVVAAFPTFTTISTITTPNAAFDIIVVVGGGTAAAAVAMVVMVVVVERCCLRTKLALFKAIISSFQWIFYVLLSRSLARNTVHRHNNKLIT